MVAIRHLLAVATFLLLCSVRLSAAQKIRVYYAATDRDLTVDETALGTNAVVTKIAKNQAATDTLKQFKDWLSTLGDKDIGVVLAHGEITEPAKPSEAASTGATAEDKDAAKTGQASKAGTTDFKLYTRPNTAAGVMKLDKYIDSGILQLSLSDDHTKFGDATGWISRDKLLEIIKEYNKGWAEKKIKVTLLFNTCYSAALFLGKIAVDMDSFKSFNHDTDGKTITLQNFNYPEQEKQIKVLANADTLPPLSNVFIITSGDDRYGCAAPKVGSAQQDCLKQYVSKPSVSAFVECMRKTNTNPIRHIKGAYKDFDLSQKNGQRQLRNNYRRGAAYKFSFFGNLKNFA